MAFKFDSKIRSKVQEETKSPDFPSTWLSVKKSHLILWLESTAPPFSNVARVRLYIPGNITLCLDIDKLLQHYYVLKIYRITHFVWMTKSKIDRICIKHIKIFPTRPPPSTQCENELLKLKLPFLDHDAICTLYLASAKKKNLGKWMSWEVTMNNHEVREG